ncbi:hypothetical protein [Deinococcus radiotolerans]|uniref:Indoleamine 2,3-dioxygenase n=1 Tax=Deinococcus radiotolerans TaxID=1309407 RepID=A0ABQ2FMJ9_9DEIO|nr:hypothetical protein [Deinococcus radiotolerans]GGL04298.1 hypothetical protein GCM10010844_23720 [Deinococcus radiotolerans]
MPQPAHALPALLDTDAQPFARTGFLPARAPVLHLPGSFQALLDLIPELAGAYGGGGVRPLIREAAQAWPADLTRASRDLSGDQRDALLSAAAVLMHLYRWDAVPVHPDRFHEVPDFPPALNRLFRTLSAARGLPPCGNLYTLKYLNWRSPDVTPGEPYDAGMLRAGNVQMARVFQAGLAGEQLDLWIQTFVLAEARGQAVLHAGLAALRAAHEQDRPALEAALLALRDAVRAVAREVNVFTRFHVIRTDLWRVYTQPTFGWGLTERGPVLEGASGLQLGATQFADLALGVPLHGPLGRALRHSRAYLPPEQRAFLRAWEPHRYAVRRAVLAWGDTRARDLFDACVQDLARWRVSHRERGSAYLRGDGQEHVMASTGTQFAAGTPHDHAFRQLMDSRIEDTRAQRTKPEPP